MRHDSVQPQPSLGHGWLLAAAAIMLAATVATTAAGRQAPAPPTDKPMAQSPGGEATAAQDEEQLVTAGEDAMKKICIECHPFDDIVVVRRTPKEWKDVVTQMATKGAIATQDQFGVVRQYLTRYYGLIPVNTAAAADLSAVLGLSSVQAEAVVEYRKLNGKFASIEALLKVPGIDKEKVETDPDALRFD